jgi:hypothetical protein
MDKQIRALLKEFLTFKKSNFKIMYEKNGTTILMSKKIKDYIIKLSDIELSTAVFRKAILSDISSKNFHISKTYHLQEVNYMGHPKTLEIMNFVPGSHIQDNSEEEMKRLVIATKDLQIELNKNKDLFIDSLPKISSLFYEMVEHSIDADLNSIGNYLLDDTLFLETLQENQYIIFGDMWNENILFSESQIGFIDLDPLLVGPRDLQFAIFLTSNLLLQKNYFEQLSIKLLDDLYKSWGYEGLKSKHLYTLCLFPLLSLMKKNINYKTIAIDNNSVYFKLKTILEYLIILIKENNWNNKGECICSRQ